MAGISASETASVGSPVSSFDLADEQSEIEQIGLGRRRDHQVDIGIESVLAAYLRPEDSEIAQAVRPSPLTDLVGVCGEWDRGTVISGADERRSVVGAETTHGNST